MPQRYDKRTPAWIGGSVLIHIILIFILAFVVVDEEVHTFEKQKVDYDNISSDTLREAAKKLEEINKRDIELKLDELQEIEEEFKKIHDEKRSELKDLVGNNPQEKLAEILKLLPLIISKQKDVEKKFKNELKEPVRRLAAIKKLENSPPEKVLDAAYANFKGDVEAIKKPDDNFKKIYRPKLEEISKLQVKAMKMIQWIGVDKIIELQKSSQVNERQTVEATHQLGKDLNQFYRWDANGIFKEYKRYHQHRYETSKKKYQVSRRPKIARTYTGKTQNKIKGFLEKYDSQIAYHTKSRQEEEEVLRLLQALKQEDIPEQVPDEIDVTEKEEEESIQDMYNKALEAEKNIEKMFKDISAADLAKKADIPVKEAQDATDVPETERETFEDPSSDGTVDSSEEFDAYRTQLETAMGNMKKMSEKASDMLASTKAVKEREESGVDAKAFYDKEQELADGANSVAADLTDFMKKGLEGKTTNSKESKGSGKSPLPSGLRAYAGHRSDGKGGEEYRVIPGNKMVDTGTFSAPWLTVNTWYLIGPFDTNNGSEFSKKFPPESIIDLDAKYIGTGGGVIRWQYVHAPGSLVGVPTIKGMSVYYAYTEIEFESARDLWVGIASDDGSKMWVNDQLVWIGAYNPKQIAWRFDISGMTDGRKAHFNHKGFRKLHFKKGLNKMLIRIDNTVGGCGFSFIISTNPQLK